MTWRDVVIPDDGFDRWMAGRLDELFRDPDELLLDDDERLWQARLRDYDTY